MSGFKSGFKRGGGSKFGGRGRGYGRDDGGYGGGGRGRGPVIMHQAVCAECGQECEVPFKPTGDRPVYCDNCFGGKKDRSSPGRNDSRGGGGNDLKNQLEILNSKMDVLIATAKAIAKAGRSLAESKSEKATKASTGPGVRKQIKKILPSNK